MTLEESSSALSVLAELHAVDLNAVHAPVEELDHPFEGARDTVGRKDQPAPFGLEAGRHLLPELVGIVLVQQIALCVVLAEVLPQLPRIPG